MPREKYLHAKYRFMEKQSEKERGSVASESSRPNSNNPDVEKPDVEDPDAGRSDDESIAPSNTSAINVFWASMAAILVVAVLMMLSGGLDSLARDFMRFFGPSDAGTADRIEGTIDAPSRSGSGLFTFEELDLHPDVVFQPYTAGQILSEDVSTATAEMIQQFRELLDLYEERQGTDDNFTIRVVDNRTNDLLEVYELDEERQTFENRTEGEAWNWGRIDGLRRTATRKLVDKYVARGIPRNAVTVKWGRRNQVLEAREREEGYIEYEVRLARYLGLSLLATEIGTVETFNDDRLVSPVGARSRYQMMPYVLRQNDVHHYRISTAAGNAIDVYEEWHPLLTMEPAFATAAGYRNAVGHEIPGISAYHTGPGNIYAVYRMFLTAQPSRFSAESTVMDAYMWAVTEGYDHVSRNSSFKTYSRGYVASAYGSLRATESIPIDSTRTVEAVRVQLRSGERIFLSELLRALEASGRDFEWGPNTDGLSLYNKFRSLNGHFVLPAASDESMGVAPNADLRLTAESQGVPVRFFLPLGAPGALAEAGFDILNSDRSFTFSHDTFGRPDPSEVTVWDRQYRQLVQDVAHFGFTDEYRQRLIYLVDRFEELAAARPTHFRRLQLEVIKTHERIWRSNVFDRLADALEAASGRARFEPRPLSPLPSGQPEG